MSKTRVLFKLPDRRGQPGHVILNWSDDPVDDLDRVAESYRSVAHDRVEALREHRRFLGGGLEWDVYPIVFLYRQAFELTLKAIILAGAAFLRDVDQEPMPLTQVMKHDLLPLFNEVNRIFEAIEPNGAPWDFDLPELRTRVQFRQVVSEFDFYDSGSYSFRYTIRKDGTTATLDRGFEFDLFAFASLMDRVIPALGGAPSWIREIMQGRWEAAWEAQVEEWSNEEHEPPDFEYEFEPADFDLSDYDPD